MRVIGALEIFVFDEAETAMETKGYYHICSDGNSAAVLFKTKVDFTAAMNRVAVCAYRMRVVIIAFVLMDNHFHFVMFATESDCIRFINEFKRLTGKYMAETCGESATLMRLPVKVIAVTSQDYLKTLVAYVLKNPTKARLDMFYNYPWGSGGLLFRRSLRESEEFAIGDGSSGIRRLGDMGVNEVRAVCRTRTSLPPDWLIKDGMILPENYIDIEHVDSLFRSPRSYMYFLSLNKDDEIEKDYGEWNALRLADSELRAERNLKMREWFGAHRLSDVSAPDRMKLAKYLRRKFLCPISQVARVVQLSQEELRHRL